MERTKEIHDWAVLHPLLAWILFSPHFTALAANLLSAPPLSSALTIAKDASLR